MKTELKINGYWWLPEQPDEKVFGTLQFTPGEILVLELQGIFQKSDRAKTRKNVTTYR